MSELKICFYCESSYTGKNTEHVFSDGIGGEDIYMENVCLRCNNSFSKLELELFRNSPLGLMRSVEGVSAKGLPSLKAPIMLYYDEATTLALEVSQHGVGIEITVKPQIHFIKGSFYRECSSVDGWHRLEKALGLWLRESMRVITSIDRSTKHCVYHDFVKDVDGKFIKKEENSQLKITCEIIVSLLPDTHEFYNGFTTRLYLDDEGKLKIRSISEEDAISFIQDFLNWHSVRREITSYGTGTKVDGYMAVTQSFNILDAERAVAKIALNCLIHYFPKSAFNSSVHSLKLYVLEGLPYNFRRVGEMSEIIDRGENTHNIFFYQMKEALSVRVSFFNGHMVHYIELPDLKLLSFGEYQRFVVDYSKRKNKMESRVEFLASFPR